MGEDVPRPVNFGYVGCGFVAQTIHIPNFLSLPGCRFVALAETRGDLRQQVAARYAISRTCASHEELAADPEIEAVGVSAPYSVQGRIAEDLLRAGKQVFMEKPMAVSVARADTILAAAREGGGRLMVGYMKRYDPGNVLVKRHLDDWFASGEAGRYMLARNHGFGGNWVYAQDPNVSQAQSTEPPPPATEDCPDWLPQEHHSNYLGYLQQWTHNVNLLRYLLGDEAGAARVASVQLDDDGMTGIVVLDIGGRRAVVESGYSHYHAWEEHTQVYFERGWVRTCAPPLMQKGQSASVELYHAATEGEPARLTEEFTPSGWSYREEAAHFLAAVRSGEPFRSSGEDTRHDVRLFEEIYRAHLGL